ncbi:MAG: redoxin domain-containing protein [Oligoflexales bacterium]
MTKKLIIHLLLFYSWNTSAASLQNGTKAPDFQLTAHDGKTYKLSQFKGKNVVLEWYNDDCPYVKKHYDSGNMQSLQKKFADQGVVWLSVISSAPGKQGHVDQGGAKKLIAARKSMPTAILLDPEGNVGKQYGAKTTPHMYIVDSKGALVYQGGIDDKPSTRAASLKTAKPLFANALTSVLGGKKLSSQAANTKPYGCSVKYK